MKNTIIILLMLLLASSLDAQNKYKSFSFGYGAAGVFERHTQGISYAHISSFDPISLRLGSTFVARKDDLSLFNFQLLATAGFLLNFRVFDFSLFTGPTFIANQIEPSRLPESTDAISSRSGLGVGWNVNSAIVFFPLDKVGFGIEAQKTFSRFGNTTGVFLIFRFRNKDF